MRYFSLNIYTNKLKNNFADQKISAQNKYTEKHSLTVQVIQYRTQRPAMVSHPQAGFHEHAVLQPDNPDHVQEHHQ